MEFAELIAAKDAAIYQHEQFAGYLANAEKTLEEAKEKFTATSEVLADAHKAIRDLLAERGEHYLIDQKDGTLTVYKPSDEPPGYLAVHPIPGTKTSETKKAK